MTSTLSKTRFRSGLQCVKKLWFENSKTIDPSPLTASDLLRFERGREVELRALERFINPHLIDTLNLEAAADQTRLAIEKGAEVITQATFVSGYLAVRIDVLQKDAQGWNLIEIKMSGELKDEHIPDVAFQKHVAELCGVRITNCFVMHLNKECVFPNLTDLFSTIDVTNSVAQLAAIVPTQASNYLAILEQANEPQIRIGGRCSKPHDCHFQDHCWKGIPVHSIFTIPRLGDKKIDELLDASIIEVINVPSTFKLTPNQKEYVDLIKGGIPIIDRRKIADAIATLQFPLYFLDFESDLPPIPEYDGMRPFSQFPFQFSLHVLSKDGELTHHSYLHPDKTDCRVIVASKLAEYIGDVGSVIVYYKPFEKGILESLANFARQYEQELLSIRDRLWDQLDIFKKLYLHPAFAGSNSIKTVLEILVPSMSYNELAIKSGDSAVANWVKFIKCNDNSEKEALRKDLESYCTLDTLAMVEIHRHLEEIIAT